MQPHSHSSVRAWSDTLVLPTYLVDPPESSPMFYDGRQTQHTQAHYYPYPAHDKLTGRKEDVRYRTLNLENEYLKVVVLPEIGGRLFSVTDKTNGYELFYRQSVVKPANIGMIGAWISGGVEWCFPHHHRASTHLTIDHGITENPDGSATIWVGEIERRHRMQWRVGVTLRPGSSALEAEVRLHNRTPFAHSALYWANAAVHTNPDYQYIFPPSARIACFHCKDAFTHWPVSHEADFKGLDLRGLDLSWWKNHPAPASFFIHDLREDFHGGYDHGRRAGTLHVADHHVVNCAKMFEWGNCPEAEMENSKLTDSDGHYAELMVGAFSDNQPDYSWMEPHQQRTFTHVWYPLREIGRVKHASSEAAVNLEFTDNGKLFIAANAVRAHRAKIRLLDRRTQSTILTRDVRLAPDEPFALQIDRPANATLTDLELVVTTEAGRDLIRYRPLPETALPDLPAPVVTPPAPAQIRTNEELCQLAIRLDQFHNPTLAPEPYLEEALRRDPTDAQAHLVRGHLQVRRLDYMGAEKALRKALAKLEAMYTPPRKGDVYYYLGFALGELDRTEDAYRFLRRAAWYAEWQGPAQLQCAILQARARRYAEALAAVESSLAANPSSVRGLELRAALERHLRGREDHTFTLQKLAGLDPLNPVAAHQRVLVKPNDRDAVEAMLELLRDDPENWIELAHAYQDAGLWAESIDVLRMGLRLAPKALASAPLVHYTLAIGLSAVGDTTATREALTHAASAPEDYCFPHGHDALRVLRFALATDPDDARAHTYLGHLLYNDQREAAMGAWRRAKELAPDFALARRNLAFGFRQQGDLDAAADEIAQALRLAPDKALWLEEQDVILTLAGARPGHRRQALALQSEVAGRHPNCLWRESLACILDQDYDRALAILENTRFFNYEARRDKHQAYVTAHLLRGDRYRSAGRLAAARADYEAALLYPENLEAGRPYHDDQGAHIRYKLALVAAAEGNRNDAEAQWLASAGARNPVAWSDRNYYQALSLRALGREEEALAHLRGLLAHAQAQLTSDRWGDFFAGYQEREPDNSQRSTAWFHLALGRLGLGDRTAAHSALAKAVDLFPANVWAQAYLREILG